MTTAELPVRLECAGDALIGILHLPADSGATGVVIIVGGPQYRVGSHRQFVLLARYLAAAGVPVLRYDYRGMGDSSGTARSFEDIDADIRCAIDELLRHCVGLRRVVLFGLCDAASAVLIYGRGDERVAGLALVNPWIRDNTSLAQTYLRHYYWQRLLQREFWTNLRHGRFALRASLVSLMRNLRQAFGGAAPGVTSHLPFQQRMLAGLRTFGRPILLIVSGQDLTAAEFVDTVTGSGAWTRALEEARLTRHELPDADHTCSRRAWRDEVAAVTLDWLRSL
jgi:exosortase A-associated hydrolase 1